MSTSIQQTALKFLKFYGLVQRRDVSRATMVEDDTLRLIHKVLNSHDCGVAAICMAISYYTAAPASPARELSFYTNPKHVYLGLDCKLPQRDGTVKLWDTSVVWEGCKTAHAQMQGWVDDGSVVKHTFENFVWHVLNGDALGIAIASRWIKFLNLKCLGAESENFESDEENLVNDIRRIFNQPDWFKGEYSIMNLSKVENIYRETMY